MLLGEMTGDERRLIGEHFAYWKDLTAAGIVLLVGRTQTSGPETLGLAVFKSESEDEAKAIAENDPAVSGGVFVHRLDPYFVALLGDPTDFRPKEG